VIPRSGLKLRASYSCYDAEVRFHFEEVLRQETNPCEAGKVLRGILKPLHCPAFGTQCKPEHPLGAPMVSSEGACAAYYRYRVS
jgi:hydrogenase expression/formation protein HypD